MEKEKKKFEKYKRYLEKYEDFKKLPDNMADSYTYEDLQDIELVLKEVKKQDDRFFGVNEYSSHKYLKRMLEVRRQAKKLKNVVDAEVSRFKFRPKRVRVIFKDRSSILVGCPLYEKYLFFRNPENGYEALTLSYLFSYM